jgi:membrane-associated phospholipid phosphatase
VTTERASEGPILHIVAAIAVVAVLVVAVALLEPIRTSLVAGGFVTPSPTRLGSDELFFGGVTAVGDGPGLVALVSAIAIALVAFRRGADAIFLVIASVGASLITRLAKDLYHAPRPVTVDQANNVPDAIPGELVIAVVVLAVVIGLLRGSGRRAIGFGAIVLVVLLLERTVVRLIPVVDGFDSFPSGHASSAATLATAMILITWGDRRWRWPVAIVAIGYALLVGLSRMYLGVHYPADVIAGWFLGVAWTIAWWLAWHAMLRRWGTDENAGVTSTTPQVP